MWAIGVINNYFGKYLSMGIQKARSDRFLCYLVTIEKWKKKKRECLSCRSRFASNRILLFFPQALIHCQVTTIKSHCYICRHYSYSSSDRIFRVAAARKYNPVAPCPKFRCLIYSTTTRLNGSNIKQRVTWSW